MADRKMKILFTALLIGAMKLYFWAILAPFAFLGFIYDEQLEIIV